MLTPVENVTAISRCTVTVIWLLLLFRYFTIRTLWLALRF